jgi:hypothetical protein
LFLVRWFPAHESGGRTASASVKVVYLSCRDIEKG